MIRCDRVIVARHGRMVIDRVSLAVGPGEALAVVGRAAAGKSSLVAALATAIPIGGGDVEIRGCSLRRDPDAARRHLGYAPPHLPAWPGVRADEFLGLFATAAGLRGTVLRDAVSRAVAMAGVADEGRVPVDRLPDGQAKRLLVARALLHAPDVLLLDDPFGNLDPGERHGIERLIGDLQLSGRTVVAAIDDGCVPDCFTHLAVLADGRLIHHGPADFAVVSAGRSWRYRIRCRGQADAAAAALAARAAAIETIDANTLECLIAPDGPPCSAIIQALVRAGIGVEGVAFHPHWTAQLLGSLEPSARAR